MSTPSTTAKARCALSGVGPEGVVDVVDRSGLRGSYLTAALSVTGVAQCGAELLRRLRRCVSSYSAFSTTLAARHVLPSSSETSLPEGPMRNRFMPRASRRGQRRGLPTLRASRPKAVWAARRVHHWSSPTAAPRRLSTAARAAWGFTSSCARDSARRVDERLPATAPQRRRTPAERRFWFAARDIDCGQRTSFANAVAITA